jgi:hypothetical protein
VNACYGIFTFFSERYVLTAPVAAVGFPVYKTDYHKTLYGPAQGAFIEFQIKREVGDGCQFPLFDREQCMALGHSDAAADGITGKLHAKFSLQYSNVFPELL